MTTPGQQCAILVGGLGTRLGTLTAATPKPMLAVAGRPFLEWLLIKAARHGVNEVLLLAGYHSQVLDDWLADGAVAARLGLAIRVSREPEPLGTAGALAFAGDRLADSFLLLNGDTWFDFDWSELTLADDAEMVLAARRVAPADRYETLEIMDGRVAAVRPRQAGLAEGLINGGVYRLRRSVVEGIVGRASLEYDILPALAARGRLAATAFDGAFIDIGLPESYAAAQTLLAEASR